MPGLRVEWAVGAKLGDGSRGMPSALGAAQQSRGPELPVQGGAGIAATVSTCQGCGRAKAEQGGQPTSLPQSLVLAFP